MISEKTNNDDCDLCGLPKATSNTACPQHEVWRLQDKVKRLEEKIHAMVCGHESYR